MNNILIETQRLIIRELKTTDFESVHCYASDPIVVKYVVWGPNTTEATMDFLQRTQKEKNSPSRLNYDLGIVLKKENLLIGGCALYITSSHNREAALGYCLNKDFWRKGYTTEAAQGMLELGFIDLKLHRIFATCDPLNLGSAKVMEKIGMQKEGLIREHKLHNGKWRNSFLYSILEQEFVTKQQTSSLHG